jgi:hypothetical protein
MSYRKLSDQALDGPDFAEAFTEVIQQDAVPLPGLPTHRTVPNRPQPRGYQLHGTKKRRAEAEIPNQTRQETCPGGDLRRGDCGTHRERAHEDHRPRWGSDRGCPYSPLAGGEERDRRHPEIRWTGDTVVTRSQMRRSRAGWLCQCYSAPPAVTVGPRRVDTASRHGRNQTTSSAGTVTRSPWSPGTPFAECPSIAVCLRGRGLRGLAEHAPAAQRPAAQRAMRDIRGTGGGRVGAHLSPRSTRRTLS